MIGAIVLILYAVAIIVTATLLYLHVQDNPTFMMGSDPKDSAYTKDMNQVLACTAASLFWPVTLIVWITATARRHWLATADTPRPVKE